MPARQVVGSGRVVLFVRPRRADARAVHAVEPGDEPRHSRADRVPRPSGPAPRPGELLTIGHRRTRWEAPGGRQRQGELDIRLAHGLTDGVELPLFANGQAHGGHLPNPRPTNYRVTT